MTYTQQTKIIGTIGPASDKTETFKKLIDAGLDVARINFSHGTHESNGAAMNMVRTTAQEQNKNIAILADLQGPRVRTVVDMPVALIDKGMLISIVGIGHDDSKEEKLTITDIPTIGFDQPSVVAALEIGHRIFIEDGLKQLVVCDVRDDGIVLAEVRTVGEVTNHKGINLPDTDVPLPSLTKKDHRDLEFILTQDVDFIALSFVRQTEDIKNLRAHIAKKIKDPIERPRIVVKIERPEAIENLTEIIKETDAVMVARGDLATETEQERVVVLQKEIITQATQYMKPVIVATQMLASMEHTPRPTRAEISDITNAVIDHTDATMLSGETATGNFATESVQTMYDIIRATEISPYDDVSDLIPTDIDDAHVQRARTTWQHAHDTETGAIVCMTQDGQIARALSHFRPQCPIVAITASRRTAQQLALVWGITAYYDKDATSYSQDDLIARAQQITQARSIVIA